MFHLGMKIFGVLITGGISQCIWTGCQVTLFRFSFPLNLDHMICGGPFQLGCPVILWFTDYFYFLVVLCREKQKWRNEKYLQVSAAILRPLQADIYNLKKKNQVDNLPMTEEHLELLILMILNVLLTISVFIFFRLMLATFKTFSWNPSLQILWIAEETWFSLEKDDR